MTAKTLNPNNNGIGYTLDESIQAIQSVFVPKNFSCSYKLAPNRTRKLFNFWGKLALEVKDGILNVNSESIIDYDKPKYKQARAKFVNAFSAKISDVAKLHKNLHKRLEPIMQSPRIVALMCYVKTAPIFAVDYELTFLRKAIDRASVILYLPYVGIYANTIASDLERDRVLAAYETLAYTPQTPYRAKFFEMIGIAPEFWDI
jgi:hypothetical protein